MYYLFNFLKRTPQSETQPTSSLFNTKPTKLKCRPSCASGQPCPKPQHYHQHTSLSPHSHLYEATPPRTTAMTPKQLTNKTRPTTQSHPTKPNPPSATETSHRSQTKMGIWEMIYRPMSSNIIRRWKSGMTSLIAIRVIRDRRSLLSRMTNRSHSMWYSYSTSGGWIYGGCTG